MFTIYRIAMPPMLVCYYPGLGDFQQRIFVEELNAIDDDIVINTPDWLRR